MTQLFRDDRVDPYGLASAAEDASRPASRPLHASRAKRAFDIAGAAALIIFFAPLLIPLYLLVRLDGGPALFGHRRVGAGGRSFTCWKFRTMVPEAEAVLQQLLDRDPAARREWQDGFKLRSDPRVTRFGAFLRKSSLDELPQLFNVLTGDMSLVGPRPIVAAEVPRYRDAIRIYAQCRPGLTGLWQISGRNDVDYDERVRLDVSYVTNWSLALDVRILLKTLMVVFSRSGAY